MDINSSRLELEKLDYFKPTEDFNGIIIVPTHELHDSGYSCMKFVLLNHAKIVGCVGGGSDVIHINGIGGYGNIFNMEEYEQAVCTGKVKVVSWSIDCLPNGLIRLFSNRKLDIDLPITSDFIIYAKEDKKDEL